MLWKSKRFTHGMVIILAIAASWLALPGGKGVPRAAEPLVRDLAELDQLFVGPEGCAECHKRAFEEWKGSYHAQSLITMLGGFKKYIEETEKARGRFPTKEELMGCLECHAPRLRFASEELVQQVGRLVVEGKKEELKAFNVECSYCHTAQVTGKPEKEVYYGPIENPIPSIHFSQYAPGIKRAEFCQSCHQFYRPIPVYCSTVYESWKKTRVSADKECQYCHMKAKDGPAAEMENAPPRVIHAHDFPGGHSPAILQEAIKLTLTAKQASPKVAVTVGIKNLAGHQFPDT
ncbi:MAG: hypothetical protein HY673_06085 [Chloroflexi bacterium]|nr:hypothetical protein [Chloroflexota bacterium]